MVRLKFLDQDLILTEANEVTIKDILTHYPAETSVIIYNEAGEEISELKINEIFDL